jgi:signal peptidase I
MHLTSLITNLAELPIVSIVWFVGFLTAARLGLLKLSTKVPRAVTELVEAILITCVVVVLVIQPFVVKAYYIPTGSMRPTLIDNDHILVNRFLFRMQAPQHGDVVVFNAPPQALILGGEIPDPSNPTDYIKRLIGLPGDTISVKAGTITINGRMFTHDAVRPYFGLSTDRDSLDQQHVKFVENGVDIYDGVKWTHYTPSEVTAKIVGAPTAAITFSPGYVVRNGQRLDEPYIAEDPDYNLRLAQNGDVVISSDAGTLVNGYIPDVTQLIHDDMAPPGRIPPGEVMVMGDNRNDSNDSSLWGLLTEDRLVGRAGFIFYPFARTHAIR